MQEQFKNLFNNQMLAANSVGTNKIFEFKFGDIIMHGVNDTMSFAKILTREFPAILKMCIRDRFFVLIEVIVWQTNWV